MKTATTSAIAFGSILAAQLVPDDLLSRVVEFLGLALLLLNTYLEWRRRQSASRS